MTNVFVKPPDPPPYNGTIGTYGTGETTAAKSRQSFDTIFTVEGTRSLVEPPPQSAHPPPSALVEPLPFQTYEFEKINQHYVPVKNDVRYFLPQPFEFIMCLMNCVCFLFYALSKSQSVNSYRQGKKILGRVCRTLAYICAFCVAVTPGVIAILIIYKDKL